MASVAAIARGIACIVACTIACVVTIACVAPAVWAQRTVADASSSGTSHLDELLARPVSIDLTQVTRQRVVDEVAAQAKVSVQYETQVLRAYKDLITVHLHNVPLRTVLERVLAGTTLRLVADGPTQVALIEKRRDVGAREIQGAATIRGVVFDSATHKPIAGVSVGIEELRLVTLTNAQGAFTLANIPDGEHVIVIKLLGYRRVTRTVHEPADSSATLRVELAPAPTILSGVVTTATGLQRRLAVGSDITVLNVDSVMKTAPIHTVTDLLENRVPGLTVIHTSGTPGDPSRIRLRGASSVLESNDPIIVVDGVRTYYPGVQGMSLPGTQLGANTQANPAYVGSARPSALDQIDPNTIETIEVFKGPSASAMYGSDAANGVIVITTKKGRPGNTRWNVTGGQGVSYIPGQYPVLTYDFGHTLESFGGLSCVAGFTQSSLTGGQPGQLCVVDSVRAFQALNDPRFSPLTHGLMSDVSATVSGGVSSLTYSFTGSASDTRGMTKLPPVLLQQYDSIVGTRAPSWMAHPDDYGIWNLSSQLSATLSPTATVVVHNLLSNSTQRRSSLGLDAVKSLIGTYVDTTNVLATPAFGSYLTKATAGTGIATTDASLTWQVWSWLPLNVTGGISHNDERDKVYEPNGLPPAIYYWNFADTSGQYQLTQNHADTKTLNVGTTVPFPLGHKRQLRVAGGINLVDQSGQAQTVYTKQLTYGVTDPSAFLPDATTVTQQTASSATYGWYVEPTFDFHSRFFVMPGIRFDGGSNGGTQSSFNKGLLALPKLSGSYVAVDNTNANPSSAASWQNILSLLRVRGTLGVAGVQPNATTSLRLFRSTLLTEDGGTVGNTGQLLETLGNTKLVPEKSREFESGFDAELFQSRLTLTTTYYYKLRLDAIMSVPLAPSVGGNGVAGNLSSVFLNVGNIRNRGLELTVQARLLQSVPINWDVNGSFSHNDNRVLSISAAAKSQGLGSCLATSQATQLVQQCIVPGYPLTGVWARPMAGFADVNGDGFIGSNEVVLGDSLSYLGTQDPRYEAAFNSTLGLWNNRLSVNVGLSYTDGLTQYNQFGLQELVSIANQPSATLSQRAAIAFASLSNYELYQTVNTFRISSASLNYQLPRTIARALHGSLASLSVQGSNLLLKSNYRGKDPNVNGFTSGEGVSDTGQLPQPRTWRLQLSIIQ